MYHPVEAVIYRLIDNLYNFSCKHPVLLCVDPSWKTGNYLFFLNIWQQ